MNLVGGEFCKDMKLKKYRKEPLETLEILEDGNTSPPKSKQQSLQLLKWCFTFNNYTKDNIKEIIETFSRISTKYVFQEETGENGTPHLQGCVFLKKKMRYSQFKLSDKIHWEKMRNDDASIAYCQKVETRTGECYSLGLPKVKAPLELITELRPWQQKIVDIYNTKPDNRTIYWFWESVGRVGKSVFTKYMAATYKCLYLNGGKNSDLMNLVFKTDMDECKCIIWDLPRQMGNRIHYITVEAAKNGMICNTKFETGVLLFNCPHIFVFSNFPPDTHKLSEDRWNIIEIE